MAYVTLVIAILLILFGCISNTENIRSAIVYKFYPIVSGGILIFDALSRLGFIIQM